MLTDETLNTELLKNWLTITTTPGIGSKTCQRILQHDIPLENFLQNPNHYAKLLRLSNKVVEAIQGSDQNYASRALKWLNQSPHHHIVTYICDRYPDALKHIDQPPMVLYAIGDINLLNKPQIGIVGTRRHSAYGEYNATFFSKQLCEHGFTITSGMALGIDGIAHQSALDNKGKTIAVLGTGIDVIYPSQHRKLAEEIKKTGLLLTEFPLGSRPDRMHFPMRNRIISGLSQGVLIVESARKSGSLITARHALEQGKEVFAIPGDIHHASSAGSHQLTKEGAKLVECVQDILDELPAYGSIQTCSSSNITSTTFTETRAKQEPLDAELYKQYPLLEHINYEVKSIDQIVELSKLNAQELSVQLLELELIGHIQSVPGGYCRS